MAVCNETRRASECATLTWLLVGDVREMLQDRLDTEAIRWIKPLLDALIRTMYEQCRLENASGYFDDVLESFPNWSEKIEAVLGEHTDQVLSDWLGLNAAAVDALKTGGAVGAKG